MIIAFYLIGLVWLWFESGLPQAFFLVAVSSGICLLLRPRYCLFILLGSAIVLVQLEQSLGHILPRNQQHQTAKLTVCIRQQPKFYDDGLISFNATVVDQPEYTHLRKIKVWLNTEDNLSLLSGDCVVLEARLRQPLGRLIPGSFNADRYYFSQHIDAIASAKSIQLVAQNPKLTERIYNQLSTQFSSTEARDIWAALLLGWSSGLNAETKSLFIDNQIMHLFVISGMHLGFVVLMVTVVLLWVAKLISPWLQITLFTRFSLILLVSFGYVAFLGFPIPVLRAFIMIFVPFFGTVSRLRWHPFQGLIVSVIITVLLWPEKWLGLGPWFSFSAVWLIILMYRWELLSGRSWLVQLLIFEAVLVAFGVPWAILAGVSLNPASVILNAILTPVVAFVAIPLGAILMLSQAGLSISLWESLIHYIIVLLELTRVLKFSLPYMAIFNFFSGFTLVFLILWHRSNLAVLYSIGFLLLLIICLGFPLQSPHTKLTLYDVGHGEAILIEKDGKTLLYDTGGYFSPGVSLFESTLSRIVPTLDGVVISHSDVDHSAGYTFLKQRRMNVQTWAGQPDKLAPNEGVNRCNANSDLLPGLYFITIPQALQTSDNDHSCILVLDTANRTVIITGDASKRVEYYLLQEFPDLFPVDIVVLGHHGSKSSSARDWLHANQNALFVASSGDRYRPEWPAKRIRQWFSSTNHKLWNTAEVGTIQLTLTPDNVAVKTWDSAYRNRLIY